MQRERKTNANGYAGDHGRAIGDANRKTIYDFLQRNPGSSIRKTAAATGISTTTTLKAFHAIRDGWNPEWMEDGK